MTNLEFDKKITALLLIDPYNDFISEGGKLWDRIKTVAEANDCIVHMLQLLTAARTTGMRVFYAMHHRYRPGDYETWKYAAPIQKAARSRKTFEYGTWGGEFRAEFAPQPGDIVAQEHWCSSGFANTDLDMQLKRHGIQRLIVAGLVAHTCVESTVRFAVELGYDVTLVTRPPITQTNSCTPRSSISQTMPVRLSQRRMSLTPFQAAALSSRACPPWAIRMDESHWRSRP